MTKQQSLTAAMALLALLTLNAGCTNASAPTPSLTSTSEDETFSDLTIHVLAPVDAK